MTSFAERAGALLRNFTILLGGGRRDRGPIDSVAALETFIASRSAFIAQKTLYGYVKTRMGIRYPAMFRDPNIVASLNIAKLNVFAACLSDLTLYAVAVALGGCQVGNDARAALARRCYESGLRANESGAPPEFSAQDCIAEFDRRLAETEWHRAATFENFTRSPRALVRWAPIAENLKKLDAEVIENSIRYGWRDVREQYRKRIEADAVCAEWSQRSAA